MGIANPVNRRNELMTRISGFEEIAKAMNLVGLFLTITTPSKFHAIKENGHHNPKYNEATPKEAQEYLNNVWQLTRSKWHRNAIRVFGFRFVEPHHDGTPHWHMLVFLPDDQLQMAIDIYRDYATAEDLEELNGDYKKRFDHILIDWSKGSAAGYVAKYVSKNIDGFKVDQDDESGDSAQSSAERVEAWTSTWGIRQFQQVGSTSVTVWRELRRGANNGAFSQLSEEAFMEIVNAADDGVIPPKNSGAQK